MEKKRLLGLFIFSLFAISLFTGFASAQTFNDWFGENVFSPAQDMFISWQEGDFNIALAKWLFLFLITLVIFTLTEYIDFLGKSKTIKVTFSLIVAFLATAYLTPENIYTMLTAYGALGIVIGGIIPFIIIAAFSYKQHEKGNVMLSKLIWIAFIIFLVYKLIAGMTVGAEDGTTIPLMEGIIYIALIALVIVWALLIERWAIKWLHKEEREMIQEKAFEEIEKEDVLKKTKAKEWEALKGRIKE